MTVKAGAIALHLRVPLPGCQVRARTGSFVHLDKRYSHWREDYADGGRGCSLILIPAWPFTFEERQTFALEEIEYRYEEDEMLVQKRLSGAALPGASSQILSGPDQFHGLRSERRFSSFHQIGFAEGVHHVPMRIPPVLASSVGGSASGC